MQADKALFAGNQLAPIVLAQLDVRASIGLIGNRDDTIPQRDRLADLLIAEVGVESSALALGQAWVDHEAQVLHVVVEW